jgi:hypothetical protein
MVAPDIKEPHCFPMDRNLIRIIIISLFDHILAQRCILLNKLGRFWEIRFGEWIGPALGLDDGP